VLVVTDVLVVMAFEDDVFSQYVWVGVKEDIKRHGMTIVIDEKLPRNLSDMTLTLTKVKSLKPDVLLIFGHLKGAITVARQIEKMKIKTPLINTFHCELSKIINKFGGAVEGILCPTQWVEMLATTGKYFGSTDFFEKVFKDKFQGYNKCVPYQAAQTVAAVLVWKNALERAQSFDTEKLRAAISEIDLETFYGNIRFSKAGNNIAKGMFLRQIQVGILYVALPENLAAKSVAYQRKPN
jgi:branched-chain amino acid transport system substrate-binding protein